MRAEGNAASFQIDKVNVVIEQIILMKTLKIQDRTEQEYQVRK